MQLLLLFAIVFLADMQLIHCQVEEMGQMSGAEESVRQSAKAAELTADTLCKKPKMPDFPEGMEDELAGPAAKEAKKTCVQGLDKNKVFWDKSCLPYPDFCKIMPPPPESAMAAFTEPYPCWTIKSCVLAAFVQLRDENPSTPFKCLIDYAIAFFLACWPGMHPMAMYKLAASGKMGDAAVSTASNPSPPGLM